MRMTSTLKFMLWSILGAVVFLFLLIYLPTVLPESVIDGIVVAAQVLFFFVVLVPIAYVTFSAFAANTSEYATGILEVYLDTNQQDIHLFTYCSQIKTKAGGANERLIQHYFLVAKTGKSYYNIVFTHSLNSLKGRSGYEGYSSFEENVLDTPDLATTLKRISDKVGYTVKLGAHIKHEPSNEYLYFLNDDIQLQITKKEKLYTTQLRAVYMERSSGKPLWTVKI